MKVRISAICHSFLWFGSSNANLQKRLLGHAETFSMQTQAKQVTFGGSVDLCASSIRFFSNSRLARRVRMWSEFTRGQCSGKLSYSIPRFISIAPTCHCKLNLLLLPETLLG